MLHDASILLAGGDDLASLKHIVCARLFDVHVLARLAGPYGLQGVMVVGSGDRHGVDGLVFEQFSDVRVGDRPLSVALLDRGQLAVEDRLIDVAERRYLDVLHPTVGADVIATPATKAHARDTNRVVWAGNGPRAGDDAGRDCGTEEVSSFHAR
jgi:hypothetical protein